jgi:ATP-dependent Lhr-like helicase
MTAHGFEPSAAQRRGEARTDGGASTVLRPTSTRTSRGRARALRGRLVSVFARFSPRCRRPSWRAWVEPPAPGARAGGRGDPGRHNAVMLAPTAGGKTEASMFPTLSMLVEHQPEGVGAIYIAPIKALLNNQAERLGPLHRDGRAAPLRVARRRDRASGGVLEGSGRAADDHPESLEVMLVSPRCRRQALRRPPHGGDRRGARAGRHRPRRAPDERDRALARAQPPRRAARGLSATVGNPTAILAWLKGTSKREGGWSTPQVPGKRELLVVALEADLARLAGEAARKAAARRACSSASRAPPPRPSPSTCARAGRASSCTTARCR